MKRYVCVLTITFSLILTSCSSVGTGDGTTIATENNAMKNVATTVETTYAPSTIIFSTEDKWEDLTRIYPLVNYDDIEKGQYANKTVRVNFIVRKNAGLYFPYSSVYKYDVTSESGKNHWIAIGTTSIINEPSISDVQSIAIGDILECVVEVSEYNDLAVAHVRSVGSIFSSAFMLGFIEKSIPMDYEIVLRQPDKYLATAYRLFGTVFQVINEDSDSLKLLLRTEDGLVYCVWYLHKDLRGLRILEDDVIAIYGNFAGLENYHTLVGNNIVPKISIVFLDRNATD